MYLMGCSSTAESISSPPAHQLQITYAENQESAGSLYAVDINCLSSIKVCAGEPVLLFQTLTISNTVQEEPKGVLTDYSWSPSGKEIVLVSERDVLIGSISSDATKWVNITNSPDIDEWQPKWSSDGNFIYYIECLDDSSGMCNPKLVRLDRFGKNKLYLLSKQDTSMTSYDISPDGQEIIYTATATEGYEQIYKASLDGTEIRQLTFGDFDNTSPSFSPDGKEIIFVRSNRLEYIDTKPEFDIVLRELETGVEKNLIEEHAGDAYAPVFSPDGEWIAFTIWDSNLTHNVLLLSLDHRSLLQLTKENEGTFPVWRFITK